ncbi:hypothetical protein ACIQRS_11115 [Streptomyces termitum]|uniref:Uncharacterized protein n=1 Tax=Streptomyces termitum TaxID=67368 RepID=A0A918W4Y3_9ACTN|nr:hypothetical protein [Streptomyces termitum]GHA69388.1 hypothetical protein GCM10010305_09440 [Streptomyces termitum]
MCSSSSSPGGELGEEGRQFPQRGRDRTTRAAGPARAPHAGSSRITGATDLVLLVALAPERWAARTW